MNRRILVPAVVVLALAIAAFIYRDVLVRWFDWSPASEPAAVETPIDDEAAADPLPSMPNLAATTFADAALERLQVALAAYERARGLLANDDLTGLDEAATAMAHGLHEAAATLSDDAPDVRTVLTTTAAAAERMASARDIAVARREFQIVSLGFVTLGAADPRLTEGLHVFRCPMTDGFGKWLQVSPRLENPYMGQQMLQCGSSSDWSAEIATAEHVHDPNEIAHYTCPMHPSVRQEEPGQCPICGMDLTPVTKADLASGSIIVDEARRQRIGVRTEQLAMRPLSLTVRAPAEVAPDEGRLHEVNLRVSGWVEELSVDETGQRVAKGQRLFTLYSPELYAAQLEHLSAVRRQGTSEAGTFVGLHRASYNRLLLLGMSKAQIQELERRDAAWENLPITSPAGGFVLEKNVVEGARVESGAKVYTIGDLRKVWLDARVYESELPHVQKGQKVEISLPFVPDRRFEGEVDYVYPTLDPMTRTARVRIVLDNDELTLKPAMYADVSFEVTLGERLAVPESAVLYTGPRRLVFVDLGEGRLQPKVVQLGVHADGYYEVKSGLSAGDVVVTSGNFLIAAESRIRSATEAWEGGEHAAH